MASGLIHPVNLAVQEILIPADPFNFVESSGYRFYEHGNPLTGSCRALDMVDRVYRFWRFTCCHQASDALDSLWRKKIEEKKLYHMLALL